jgi:hypothetical protein
MTSTLTLRRRAEALPLILFFAVFAATAVLCQAALLAQETSGEPAAAPDQAAAPKLNEHLALFQPFIGTWEINAQWESGDPLWARNEYRVGMNGNFVLASTWARDANGEIYQRYQTTWRYDPERDQVESHGFTYDGSYVRMDTEIHQAGEGNPVIGSRWKASDDAPWFRQEVQMLDDNTYSWKVWTSPDGNEWIPMMDGQWKRTSKTKD